MIGQVRQQWLANVAIAGFSLFALILVSLHFVQPELDPLRRFGSEYSAGRMGWLMRVAFFFMSAGLAATATAIGFTARGSSRSRSAGVLLWISSLGIFLSGVFNADLQGTSVTGTGIAHDLAGFVAFLTLLPAMIIVSRSLRTEGVPSGAYYALKVLAWTSLILFAAFLFYFSANGLAGLGQRIFLLSIFAWLFVTVLGVRTGVLFRAD